MTASLVGATLDIRIESADTPVALSYDVLRDAYTVESPGLTGPVSFANGDVTTVSVTGTADPGQDFTLGASSLPDGAGLFDGLVVDPTVETTTLFGAIRSGGGVTIGSSTITLFSAVETIAANQSYAGAVVLASDVVLTGGRVAFGGGVGGQGHGLVLDFADTTTIDGDAFTGIGDFASGGGGTTVLSGTLATIGSQVFADDVELHPSASLVTLAAVTGSSPGGFTRFGDVSFLGTVTGAGGLRINADGITSFAAPVSLGSFSTDDAGTTRLATPSFTTTGAQGFFDTLALATDTALVADSIKLTSVAGMGNRLSLAVTQTVALDAAMFADLQALSVTGPVSLAGSFAATESLSFSSPLALNSLVADTILAAPIITLAGEYQANGTLLWCLGTTSISGFVSGLNELRISGAGLLSGSLGADTHAYGDAVSLTGRTQFNGGTASFGQGLDGFGNHLTLALSSAVTVDNGVFRGVGDFDTASFTTAVLRSFTTSGSQSYGGPVEMSGPVTLAASHVEFRGTVVGPDALTIVTSGADGQSFDTEIHGAVSVGSLEITGTKPTALFFGGAVETIGIQRYASDLVTFPSVTTLTGSEVTVTGTVDGRGTILLIPGNAVFGSQVFSLSRLEVGGTTSLAGNVTTDLNQVYGGRVTLTADSVLTGTIGSFPAGVDADGRRLGLMFSEPMTLDPKVFSGVGAFSVGGGGTTTLVTDIVTTAGQYYLDELLLQADVSLVAGSEGITFAGPVRSTGQELRTVTSGDTSFGDEVVVRKLDVAVGRTVIGVPAAKASVTIDSALAQSFAGDVLVIRPAVLTAGGGFSFGGAVTGPSSLSLRSDQTTLLRGPVSLGSLHTDAGGTTRLETGVVTTTDPNSLEFGDPVILTTDTVFDAGSGSLTFKSTVDGPFAVLAKSSGATTFAGPVGSQQQLASLTTDAGGTARLTAVATTGAQLYQDDSVSLAGAYTTANAPLTVAKATSLGAATSVSTGAGAVSFGGSVDGPFALVVNSSAATAFAGPVGSKDKLASLTTDEGGTVSLGAVATSGAQLYQDDSVSLAGSFTTADAPLTITKATALGAPTSVSTGSGPVSFGGPVDGPFALAVSSSSATRFAGPVGANAALRTLATDAGGTTALDGGSVATVKGQTYGDPVILGGATLLSAADAGVAFAAAVTGTAALTVNAPGTTSFGKAVAVGSLTTDAPGTTEIRGGAITTTLPAGQSYGDPVLIGARATVAAGSGPITFLGTVSGKAGLRVTTNSATTFAGAVSVANLETDAGGTVVLGDVTTTGFQKYRDDVVTLAGTLATGGGAFTIDRATKLAGMTTVASGTGPITFAGPVDGAVSLTAVSAATTQFGGVVGAAVPLAALATDAGGTTRIAAPLVRVAAGGIGFGDPVRVAVKTAVESIGGPVRFGAQVDGRFPLSVAADGAVEFAAAIGATAPLGGLTLSRAASVVTKAPIQLVGTAAQADGLIVAPGLSGIVATAPGSFVAGFSGSGIRFLGGARGSSLAGFTVSGNRTGVRVASGDYAGSAIENSRIVSNQGSGIVLDASTGTVGGLRIGGTQPLGSGGAGPIGNRIAANARHGIETTAGAFTGTTIVGNAIVGNGSGGFGSGLAIAGTGIVVGWDGTTGTAARPNQISGNAANGVLLSGASVVLSNVIHSNGGEPGKGILATGTAAATAPAPVIARSVRDNAAGVVRIQVRVPAAAAGHLVQLYANARDDIFRFPVNTAAFEGRALLASAQADGSGLVTFELPSASVPVGTWLTATATRLDANGGTLTTSAFSPGAMATAAPVIAVGGDGPATTWDREIAYTVGDKGTLVAERLTAGLVASLTARQAGKLLLADIGVILTPEAAGPAVVRAVADVVTKGDGVEITLAPAERLVVGTRGTLALATDSLPAARLVDASLVRDTATAPVGPAAVVGEILGTDLAAALDRARAAGETSATAAEIHAFVNRFQGGVRVAAADLDADGHTDMVIAPGAVPAQLLDPSSIAADGTGRPLAAVFGAAARTLLLVNGKPGGGAWSTVALDMSSLLDAVSGYAGGFAVAVGDVLAEGLPAGRAGLPELVVATTGLVDPATGRSADRAWVFDLAVADVGAVPSVERAEPAADGTRAPRPVQELTLPAAKVTGVTVGAFTTDVGQSAAPQGTVVVATTTAGPAQLATANGISAMDTAQVTLFRPTAQGIATGVTLPLVAPIESGPARTLQNAFIYGASLASGDIDGDLKTDLVVGAARGGQGAFRVVDNTIVRALLSGAGPTAAALGSFTEALSTSTVKFGVAGPHGGRPNDNGGAWQPKAGTDFFLGKSIPLPTGAGFNAPLSIAVVERSGRTFTADVFAALGASNQATEQVRWYEWQTSGSWRAGDALRADDPAATVVSSPGSANAVHGYFRFGRGLRLG